MIDLRFNTQYTPLVRTPGPTGSEPCDFLAPQQTTVYDDPDGADFYAWSPAEPRDTEDVFVFVR